jgi:hypothetical protein
LQALIKAIKDGNSFDINNLVRENVKTMKPYSSARDEFKDFDVAQMIFFLDIMKSI